MCASLKSLQQRVRVCVCVFGGVELELMPSQACGQQQQKLQQQWKQSHQLNAVVWQIKNNPEQFPVRETRKLFSF